MRRNLKLVQEPSPKDLGELSDDELMLLTGGGRQRPFAELVGRHQPLILGYATRYLGDSALAGEIAQEVFVTLWQESSSYKPKGRFRSFLVAIAFNRCRAAARRRGIAKTREAELDESTTSDAHDAGLPLQSMLETERARRLRSELMRLNERTRAALIMRFFSEMSYEEISQATGQRVGTLKSQVCRGLKQLHHWLSEEQGS